jgi:hypothetical protein
MALDSSPSTPTGKAGGKPATTGSCPTCGTKVFQIGKAAGAPDATPPDAPQLREYTGPQVVVRKGFGFGTYPAPKE